MTAVGFSFDCVLFFIFGSVFESHRSSHLCQKRKQKGQTLDFSLFLC